jgi:hypothetical protein
MIGSNWKIALGFFIIILDLLIGSNWKKKKVGVSFIMFLFN